MDILKNKLFVVLVIIGLVVLVSFWFYPRQRYSEAQLTAWITTGYSQQFCRTVFLRIANCVTLSNSECLKVAKQQITDCVNDNKYSLPDTAVHDHTKEIYDSFSQCFEQKMHDQIKQNYIADRPECHKMLD